VSETLTPIISPKVKTELTSGLPNSLAAAASWSRWSGLRIVGEGGNQDIIGLGKPYA
jgi:hypothetical protein